MDFGNQIKQIRTDHNLTQEQMGHMLHVSRQAISNWENDKNLPDLELLILISKEFSVSLDQLILGGTAMNNMTAKLIKDGSETRRVKMRLILIVIGTALLCMGAICFILKQLSPEYVDAQGVLHEKFFFIPLGFLFLFGSAITFSVAGVKKLIERNRGKESKA